MIRHVAARSISRPAADNLRRTPFVARVLAAFEQACDLVTPNGDVIAIVTPQIGDGPLNIVVEAEPGVLGMVEQDASVELDEGTLRFSRLEIALEDALAWEPCPDWSALRTLLEAIKRSLPALRAIAMSHAPTDSLLAALDTGDPHATPNKVENPASYVIPTRGRVLAARPGSTAKNLRSGWEEDATQLQDAATHLAGLGTGLTPAGDDFLAGAMLWAWLTHPAPGPLCQALVEVAAPRTTTLSAAFLHAAARGECDATWHRLLAVLSTDGAAQLAPAVQQIMAHGATSGADMLAGFLWMAGG